MLVFQPIRKYADFSGRARRKEFWLFYLFVTLLGVVIAFLDGLLVVASSGSYTVTLLSYIFAFGILIPSVAVAVRRLHDTNRKGWWLLIYFIPLIGLIWLIVLWCFRGNPEENKYGNIPPINNPITTNGFDRSKLTEMFSKEDPFTFEKNLISSV